MAKKTLGTLERVDLRNQWSDEAHDFTRWLATEPGLSLLGDTMGLELALVGQERRVGSFRADILAQVIGEDEEHYIVIENQLEETDHSHLGKLITYAAGLGAATIVWVAETFAEEHRQALDWLNENAGENLSFFGLQIDLWRIGDSVPAPQFKIVSSPNEWVRSLKADVATAELTVTKQDQLLFWEELRTYAQSNKSTLAFRKPRPQHWYTMAVGRAGFEIRFTHNSKKNQVGCNIVISLDNAKDAFDLLKKDRELIEAEIGNQLEWKRLDSKKESRIALYHPDLAIEDPQQREKARVWLYEMAEKFYQAFFGRIRALDMPGEDDIEVEETA